MTLYGYARVSTGEQDLSLQEAALQAAGCQVIRAEKKTGTRREGRTELDILLQFLRPGDTLVITRIDRLARSLKDLQDIVHELKEKGVTLKATEQPVDTSTAAGKAFFDMLGVFAEFETNLRRERQMEGIVAAKAGRLQGSQAEDRSRGGPQAALRGTAQPHRHRKATRDRALVGLQVPARNQAIRSTRTYSTRSPGSAKYGSLICASLGLSADPK